MHSVDATPAVVIVALYALVGASCGVLVRRRGESIVNALVLVPLWPLLAPELLRPERPVDDRLVAAVSVVRAQLGDTAGERERKAVDGLVAHLLAKRKRLEELRVAREQAPDRIRPKLDELDSQLRAELAAGESLLEELGAQLTVARLSGATDSVRAEVDRLSVEDLVARLEALVPERPSAQPEVRS
ncbi:MAG: hypothetical protein JNG84_13500 [Archangium sp.]|nr:hypothetical protein [Archangium sp.]